MEVGLAGFEGGIAEVSFGASTGGFPEIAASAGGTGSRRHQRIPFSSSRRKEAVSKSSGLPREVEKTLRWCAVLIHATGSRVVCPSTRPCMRGTTVSAGCDCL